MTTEQLIEALLEPDSYPHPVEVITTIETHISIVFLTGEFAYKLKKPVDFGFLNFSTLENRKKFCQLEVALNQRTAPELYLGVYEVFSAPTENTHASSQIIIKPQQAGNKTAESQQTETVLDYLVKMRQFNPNHVLGKMLKHDCPLSENLLEKLADNLSAFHHVAEKVALDTELGTPKTQLQPMLDNLPTLFKHFKQQGETHLKLIALENWTLTQFEQWQAFITQRRNEGFVRACHGDLHLDNIAIIDEAPLIFDGIEFNEHFRWIDCISDLAFLLIDMEFKNQKSASDKILSLYLSKTLDYNALYLLNFYRVYRTLVRAKITALRSEQLPLNSPQHQQVLQTAKRYIEQAYRYLSCNEKPKCILMQGVSGSGKSFLANSLLEKTALNAIIISSDRIRKSLFGIASTHRVTDQEKSALYSASMNKKTYAALQNYAEVALKSGFNVIIDATFLLRKHRQPFYELAEQQGAKPYLLSINSSNSFAEQAIEKRQTSNNNPSDANYEIMLQQRKVLEPADVSENALQLDSSLLWQQFPQQKIQEFLDLPIE